MADAKPAKPRAEVMLERIGKRQVAIEGKLDRLTALVEQLLGGPAVDGAPAPAPAPPTHGGPPQGTIASDADLDGSHGDPEVRKDPKRWKGTSYQGAKMSACPSDYLDELAAFFDWQAEQDEKKGDPRARYKRLDAARARGWAMRNRPGGRHRSRPAAEMTRDKPRAVAPDDGPPPI